jgi:NAD(P)-dependent dehydrogenase (short-subunit alcohol dehydrogenase family)
MALDEVRCALVTGANRGIGLGIVRGLADRGWQVVLTARREEDAREAAAGLGRPAVTAVQLDVRQSESVIRAARDVEACFGRLDSLVNNAAAEYDPDQQPSMADLERARMALEVNVLGAWRTTQAFLPLLQMSPAGRIVNVSTSLGSFARTGGPSAPAYSVSKAALNMLTRKLALDLKGSGILVNAADPGWVRTRMGGSGAPRSPEQGADTPIWLATLPEGGPTGGFFRDREPIPW